MRTAKARLPTANALINVGGDGNDFAVFISAMLRAIGANVRLANGCAKASLQLTMPPATVASGSDLVQVCQLQAEVRLGKTPVRITSWARSFLGGSKWVGKTYHYRLDAEGFAWLNLDFTDSRRIQRPGLPYKAFETQTIYYPDMLTWEVEGDEFDSTGQPRQPYSAVHTLNIGLR